jgi:predicted short-subunit dehydrogenase-like oxidoreductase (DUF2520 family)
MLCREVKWRLIMKQSIAIVGCGTIGTTLGKLFADVGHPIVGVASRRLESARRTAEIIGISNCSANNVQVTPDADVVFVATPDAAIQSVCDEIAMQNGFKKGASVFHCSGVHSSEILASARQCGTHIGSLHPLQSFASVEQALQIVSGCTCTFEGDPELLPLARELVEEIGANFIQIRVQDKPLYHAAAVVASNYLVTLLDLAIEMNQLIGISEKSAIKAFLPLIRGTLHNVENLGIHRALTGPIVRGDIDTITSHIEAIKTRAPQLFSLYMALGNSTVAIAEARGGLGEVTTHKMRTLFGV